MTRPHPMELRFRRAEKRLYLVFENGDIRSIPFELLRVASPSAEVRGHGGARPLPLHDKANVDVLSADPVGHYALRIRFDDGHASGLFTWAYLSELSENADQKLTDHHGSAVEARFQKQNNLV